MPTTADRGNAPLSETVLSRLRDEIITGGLPPGTALSVPALASRWGVSRSPVREAVQQLVSDGLAEYRPHAGARVAALDRGTLRQVFEVREMLDGMAARQAAPRATRADLSELSGMVARQEALLEEPADPRRDSTLDLDFHTRVRELSGNRPLCEALKKLDVQSYLYRSDAWHGEANRRHSVAEHRAIITALDAGDAYGAQRAAQSHAAAVLVRILREDAGA